MKTINVDLSTGEALNLLIGRQGENNVTQVIFDFSALKTEFGSGTLSLSVKRPKEYVPYAQTMTVSGTNATWLVNETDTGNFGCGEIQLTYTVSGKVAKTVIYKYTVYRSIGVDGEYPIPGQTWQEEMEEEIADIKQDLQDLQEEIEGGGSGSGLTTEEKTLIITIMRNGLYSTDQSDNIDALEDAFFAPVPATGISLNQSSLSFATLNSSQQLTATLTPRDATDTVTWYSSNDSVATVSQTGLVTSVGYGNATITATAGNVSATCSILVAQATVTSISAAYTQSGTVYDSDSLNSLKDDLVVTAHWSNGTTSTLADDEYTLSGTLTEGTSTITVSYGGQTTTFNVTVTHFSISLDTIIYEGKSYRDIFMTANQVQGFDFENGVPQGCTVGAGSPAITDEASYSTSHSLKAFGTSSTQYKSNNVTDVVDWNKYSGKTYFTAFKAKCDRYASGYLGLSPYTNNHLPSPVTAVTDGWITVHNYNTNTGGYGLTTVYVGSFTSANLDGYLDDIVIIPMSDIFTETPTEAQMLQWYNDYCDIRKDGGE